MLKLLADEDFNNRIVRGLRRRVLAIDLVRVHEVNLLGKPDAEILDRAARDGRLTLSQYLSIGDAIEDISLIAEGSQENEWSDQVLHLPLK